MAIQIQLRRGTAAQWTSANPTLAVAELGIETDTDQFKIGDGATAWTSLGYGGIVGPTGATGAAGVDSVAAATAPITYDAGTQTIGIDQTGISITASQLSDVTATAAELNVLDGITATATELNYTDGVTSGIQTQLDAKAPLTPAVNAKTGAYTLTADDRGELITCDGTFTITVPSATFSAGDRVDFVNIGTGVVTFAAGAGLTLNSVDDAVTIDTQWAGASVFFTSAPTAVLVGRLA
jgi:hypothetical protein